MKCALAKEHRDFFHKRGWIEFESVLSENQLMMVNQAIDCALAERLQTTPPRIPFLPAESLYLHGRDVWRAGGTLRRWAMQVRLAQIASELIERKPLRLGYDQFFPPYHHSAFADPQPSVYAHFLAQTESLEAISCIQGVACGLLIALNDQQDDPREHTDPSPAKPSECASVKVQEQAVLASPPDPFPYRAGHVIFFQPHLPIPWSYLQAHPRQRFYLITYAQSLSHYRLQPKDPHTHALKRLGYILNDKLNDKLHPIVYR